MAKFLEPSDVFDVDALPAVGSNVIKNGDLPSSFVFSLADANHALLLYGGVHPVTIAVEDIPRSSLPLVVMAPSFCDRMQVGICADGKEDGIVYVDGTDYQINVSGASLSPGVMGAGSNQWIWGPGPSDPSKMIQLSAPSNLGEFKAHALSVYKSTDNVFVYALCFRFWRSSTTIS